MINSQHSRNTGKKQEDIVLIGKLTIKPGGQLLLNEKPCKVEMPESLIGLGSIFLGSLPDTLRLLIAQRPSLQQMWFDIPSVAITPTKGRNNYYLAVSDCRTYLLWRALNPSPRNPLSVLVLPKLRDEEVAHFVAREVFGDPLLYLLFNEQRTELSTSKARRRHRGNLQQILNDAIENIHILKQSIRQFLGLSWRDLKDLLMEIPYYRVNHQPEESQEKVDITPSEAESNQGDGPNAEVPPDPTPGPESVQDETPDAKSTVNSSDANDLSATSGTDNELKAGDVPDRTHICDTATPEGSQPSVITDPAATAGAPTPPAPQESQTPVDPPAVYPTPTEPDPNQNEQLPG